MQEYADMIEERSPWLQIEGEPDKDFHRFDAYYLPQPQPRSVRNAYFRACQDSGEEPHKNAPSLWYEAARTWEWERRGVAHDAMRREERRKAEAEARVEAQRKNRDALDKVLADGLASYDKAKDAERRLWADTVIRITAERRREYGYDTTRILTDEPDETLELTLPGLNDD